MPEPRPEMPEQDGNANVDVSELIALGESQHVEFKSTFRWDVVERRVNRDLQKVIAKTVAGLLNTHGGHLFIGVADDGAVLGIQDDLDSMSKKSNDGFELAMRATIGSHLGPEIGPDVTIMFHEIDTKPVAHLYCKKHPQPVFFRDAERGEFYVRDGNRTIPLDVRASHDYISRHWPPDAPPVAAEVTQLLELVRERLPPPVPRRVGHADQWLRVAHRRVINLFLDNLVSAKEWKQLYIISPWISTFSAGASLTFDAMLRRIVTDGTTVYVVTRPPESEWHHTAISRLGETGRANVVSVPDLHVKLFTARTNGGEFAMLGSANLTQNSLANREIGALVNSFGDGRAVVSNLTYEASQIYRAGGRKILYRAQFRSK